MAPRIARPCPCGSHDPRRELIDAMGVFVAFTCDACEPRVRARYDPAIFDASRYPRDEPLDPEWPDAEDDRTR